MKYKREKYQASINFHLTYPPKLQKKLQNIIWREPVEKRYEVWNKHKVPFKEIEKGFTDISLQRNLSAAEKGFDSSVGYYLNLYKIPTTRYKEMLKNIDEIVRYCNSQLPNICEKSSVFYSEFGNHCYICTLENFPFNNVESVKKYIFNNDKLLKTYKGKVMFMQDTFSRSSYNKVTNKFEVYIDKGQNSRHQVIDAVHELAHIKNRILITKNYNQLKTSGTYFNELNALKIELDLLKAISQQLYQSIFGEFLKVFHMVLFEIEVYSNPQQNLGKLYAATFNKCYTNAKQTMNRSFILDSDIVRNPFRTLPHAVAQSTIIMNLIRSSL